MDFVILATRRTGSSYLTRLLRQPPHVFCHGEIFNPAMIQPKTALPRWTIPDADVLLALRTADPKAFLSRVAAIKFDCALVGFKMMANHEPRVMAQVMADRAVRKIVLSRRNRLAQYASERAAREVGSYSASAEKPPVIFRRSEFERFLGRTRAFYEQTEETLRATAQEFFPLHFDQINDAEVVGKLLRFIGCDTPGADVREPPGNRASADVLSRFDNPQTALDWLEENGLAEWRFENERLTANAS